MSRVIDVGGSTGSRSATVLDLVVAEGRLGVRRREGTVLAGVPDRLDLVAAEAMARQFAAWHHRCAAQHRQRPGRADGARRPARPRRPAGPRRGAVLAPEAGHRAAARAAGHRPARRAGRARPEGVRRGRHGPARPGHRRHRLGQERAAAHPGHRAGRHALLRDAQPRADRLQGRRDVRRHGRPAAHLRGHHQPRRRPHPGRPHGRRAARRAGAAPGTAARGRQLRLGPRLRAGPRSRRRPAAAARRCWSSSTSSASCCRPGRSSSTCS